jgi:hypothetical protein
LSWPSRAAQELPLGKPRENWYAAMCNLSIANNFVTTILHQLLTTLGYITMTGQSKRAARYLATFADFRSPGGNRHRTLSSGGVAAAHCGS